MQVAPQVEVKERDSIEGTAKAQNKWISKAYDRINLTVVKGRREIIKAHAEAHGESVNSFINRAIDETMERDRKANTETAPE